MGCLNELFLWDIIRWNVGIANECAPKQVGVTCFEVLRQNLVTNSWGCSDNTAMRFYMSFSRDRCARAVVHERTGLDKV